MTRFRTLEKVERAAGNEIAERRRDPGLFESGTLNWEMNNPPDIARRQQALCACDWKSYVWCHPRAYRILAFTEVMRRMDPGTYWHFLGELWIDTESPSPNRFIQQIWLALFSTTEVGERDRLMTREELATLAALPDPVRIYRGALLKLARGMSWTTDLEKALWFAGRFSSGKGQRAVFAAEVPKNKILAYFSRREEAEIILDAGPPFQYQILEGCEQTPDQ